MYRWDLDQAYLTKLALPYTFKPFPPNFGYLDPGIQKVFKSGQRL